MQRGQTTTVEKGEALLERITPTADYDDLAGCDLVIEAVFESAALKQEVFAEAMKVVAPDALLCSNTSTLPITSLAEGVDRPGGLHRPALLLAGRQDAAHRDHPRASAPRTPRWPARSTSRVGLRKTPIVVNDSRGFFTSRVISTFLNEGVAMLAEGIDPQTIEQASSQAGYPAPVLQLMDELTLTLPRKIRDEARAAAGDAYVPHPAEAVIDRLVEEFGRTGRSPAAPGSTSTRTGKPHAAVARVCAPSSGATNHDVDLHELAERMLFVEAVETQRCLDEGVLTASPTRTSARCSASASRRGPAASCSTSRATRAAWPAFVARADALADAVRRAVPGSRLAARPPHAGAA